MAKLEVKHLDMIYDDSYVKAYHHKNTYSTLTENKVEYTAIRVCMSSELNDEIFVDLDISTAIKFAKTLRTEINKAKEGGQDNG